MKTKKYKTNGDMTKHIMEVFSNYPNGTDAEYTTFATSVLRQMPLSSLKVFSDEDIKTLDIKAKTILLDAAKTTDAMKKERSASMFTQFGLSKEKALERLGEFGRA